MRPNAGVRRHAAKRHGLEKTNIKGWEKNDGGRGPPCGMSGMADVEKTEKQGVAE